VGHLDDLALGLAMYRLKNGEERAGGEMRRPRRDLHGIARSVAKRRIRTSPERPVAVLRASCAGALSESKASLTHLIDETAACGRGPHGAREIDEVPQRTWKTITAPTRKFFAYSNTYRIVNSESKACPLKFLTFQIRFGLAFRPHVMLCEISPG
jgi:hypothetical protein